VSNNDRRFRKLAQRIQNSESGSRMLAAIVEHIAGRPSKASEALLRQHSGLGGMLRSFEAGVARGYGNPNTQPPLYPDCGCLNHLMHYRRCLKMSHEQAVQASQTKPEGPVQ
jgi:hypothetical protein